jgi:hypothetical protein
LIFIGIPLLPRSGCVPLASSAVSISSRANGALGEHRRAGVAAHKNQSPHGLIHTGSGGAATLTRFCRRAQPQNVARTSVKDLPFTDTHRLI